VGILQRSEVGKIGLEVDGSMLSFDLANIDKARLVPVL
jgi:ribosome maturation factor RimP